LAFVNVGPQSLHDARLLGLLEPRRTVLELSRAVVASLGNLEQVRTLRAAGFGVALMAELPFEEVAPWLTCVSHIKVDIQRVAPDALSEFAIGLSAPGRVLIAEKVETEEQARLCLDLGFDGLQGWYVGRPEVMGRIKPGVSYAVIGRALVQLEAGCDLAEVEQTLREDLALCWRLLRYTVACNHGLMVTVESLSDAMHVIGAPRLIRWLELVLNTVEEATTGVRSVARVACLRGRTMAELGIEYFSGTERDNLFLVGMFSLLPTLLMEPMDSVIASLALPDAVIDALTQRSGSYGPFLDLAEALELDDAARIQLVCEQLSISTRGAKRAWVMAQASLAEGALA
jgi:EAL and modified HD-GYP domain-containing signal transduction protein